MISSSPTATCAGFVNSLPKAGTHLLTKVVKLIPGVRSAGVVFLPKNAKQVLAADDPGVAVPVGVDDPVRVARDEIRDALDRVEPGSFASGHVPYSKEMAALLEERGMKSVLILRDPRDVAVSHAKFIPERPGERLYPHYLPLSPAERLMASLVGFEDAQAGCRCRNIRERVESLLPWTTWPDNHTVRFERLVGPDGGGTREAQREEIRRLCEHFGAACSPSDINRIADEAFGGTNTFRKGAIGAWREHFNLEHTQVCKKLIGQLLIDLGYETGLNWE